MSGASTPEDLAPIRPRLLSAVNAALYCGYDYREAVTRVPGFPRPVPPATVNAHPRWDVHDLDAWIDARKAGTCAPAESETGETEAEAEAHAAAIVARSRARLRRGA